MSRIAVKMDTDTIPVSGVQELDKHLDELLVDPTLSLTPRLFDDVELQLTGRLTYLVSRTDRILIKSPI